MSATKKADHPTLRIWLSLTAFSAKTDLLCGASYLRTFAHTLVKTSVREREISLVICLASDVRGVQRKNVSTELRLYLLCLMSASPHARFRAFWRSWAGELLRVPLCACEDATLLPFFIHLFIVNFAPKSSSLFTVLYYFTVRCGSAEPHRAVKCTGCRRFSSLIASYQFVVLIFCFRANSWKLSWKKVVEASIGVVKCSKKHSIGASMENP